MEKNQFIQIITTVDEKEIAEKIAKKVVEKRMVACAQIIGPIKSIYWWKEKIEESEEWMVVMKSKKEFFKKVEKVIRDIHPYEVPEIIAFPVIEGYEEYLKWLDEEIGGEK